MEPKQVCTCICHVWSPSLPYQCCENCVNFHITEDKQKLRDWVMGKDEIQELKNQFAEEKVNVMNTLSELAQRVERLENHISDAGKKMEKIEDHVIKMTEAYLRKIIKNASPHKCPVCEGYGNIYNQENTQVAPCSACDKGIVWG